MKYLSNLMSATFSNIMFIVFIIAFIGYMIGAIEIKGIKLGTSAAFLVSLIFGHFGFTEDSLLHSIGLITTSEATLKSAMSLFQSIGLICFVTSVGLIAGPRFFHNLKKNAGSYVLLAVVIIGLGALSCVLIILLTDVDSSLAVGLMSGALTTTPGFAAAQEAVVRNEYLLNEISVGYAIAYPFGVVGVVLFIQLIPKLLKTNMQKEKDRMNAGIDIEHKVHKDKLFILDKIGLAAFSLAAVSGVLLGKVTIPLTGGIAFSLGNTGGTLIMGLVIGHFGHLGKMDLRVMQTTLETFREFGLMMFLIGAGVPGGSGFIEIIKVQGFILFVYGAIMTCIPMIFGYLFARYVLRLSLLNNLGSITGGMTSTPALGTLINISGTDDVVSAYAATYPVALVLVVLACQFIITFI